MAKTISGNQLRERMRAKFAAAAETKSPDWVAVLGSSSNREMLGLIGRLRPRSVNELAELAHRAQPNVSRSLGLLVGAGLIQVSNEGRRSVPSLTALGREKATELDLLDTVEGEALPGGSYGRSGDIVSTNLDAAVEVPSTLELDPVVRVLMGTLEVKASARGVEPFRLDGDLSTVARRLLDHWWRVFHRRDAPFRIATVDVDGPVSLRISSLGRRLLIEKSRVADVQPLPALRVDGPTLEEDFVENLLRPVVRQFSMVYGQDLDLQAKLARLEDSRSDAAMSEFYRTAGALGFQPHVIDSDQAESVRHLVSEIGDEDARLDFASSVLAEGLENASNWTRTEIARIGSSNSLDALEELRRHCYARQSLPDGKPHEVGIRLAKSVRGWLRLSADQALGDTGTLARLLGAHGELTFSDAMESPLRGFRWREGDAVSVAVRDAPDPLRKFVLARAVGDCLAFAGERAYVSELYTSRQAVGRAFAAELIAPFSAVVDMVDNDDQTLTQVARHFGASPELVRRQYINNARSDVSLVMASVS